MQKKTPIWFFIIKIAAIINKTGFIIMKRLTMSVFFVAVVTLLHAQLPAVTLKTIDGQTVRTDTLSNNGKPFIVDFFAILTVKYTIS